MTEAELRIRASVEQAIQALRQVRGEIAGVGAESRASGRTQQETARANIEAAVRQREAQRQLLAVYREQAAQAKRGSDEQIVANRLAAKSALQLGEAYKAAGHEAATAARRASRAQRDEAGASRGFLSKATGLGGWIAGPGFIAGAAAGLVTVDAVKETLRAQEAERLLRNALKDTNQSWADNRAQIAATLRKQMDLSGFTKVELTQSLSTLIRATGDTTKAERLLADATDVARGRRIGLTQATLLLTKASEGNVGALRRLGIDVSKTTRYEDQLKAAHIKVTDANRAQVTELGKRAKAMDLAATKTLVLNTVEQKYHGAAKARSETLQGRIDRLRNTYLELMVTVGTKLIPVLTRLLEWMQKVLDKAQHSKRVHDDLRRAVELLKQAWAILIGALRTLMGVLRSVAGFLNRHHDLVKTIIAAWVAWKGAMIITGAVNKTVADLRRIREAWNLVHDAVVKALKKIGLLGKTSEEQVAPVEGAAAKVETANTGVATSAEGAAGAEASIGTAATADVAEVGAAATAIEGENAAIAASADAAAASEAGIGAAAAGAAAAGGAAGVGAVAGVAAVGAVGIGAGLYGLLALFSMGETQLCMVNGGVITWDGKKLVFSQRGLRQVITAKQALDLMTLPSARLTAAGRKALQALEHPSAAVGKQQGIVQTALAVMRGPYAKYVYGGGGTAGPSDSASRHDKGYHFKGFDCSGFVQYVMAQNGIQVPRTSQAQAAGGVGVPLGELAPGDLVFTEGWPHPGHVGIYIGDGKIIEDPHTGASIRITTVQAFGITGARRYYRKNTSGMANDPMHDAGGRGPTVGSTRTGAGPTTHHTPPPKVSIGDQQYQQELARAKAEAAAAKRAADAAKAAHKATAREATPSQLLSEQDKIERELQKIHKAGLDKALHVVVAGLKKLYAELRKGMSKSDLAMLRVHYVELEHAAGDAIKKSTEEAKKRLREQKREIAKHAREAAKAATAELRKEQSAWQRAWGAFVQDADRRFDQETQAHLRTMQRVAAEGLRAMQEDWQRQMRAYDQQTQAGLQSFVVAQTPEEKAYADFLAQQQAAQHAATEAQLQSDLAAAIASGDPAQIKAAQDAINAQLLQDQQDALQKAADLSRVAQDKKTQDLQDAYQQQRDDQKQSLEDQEADRETAWQQAEQDQEDAYQLMRDDAKAQMDQTLTEIEAGIKNHTKAWTDVGYTLGDSMVGGILQALQDAGIDPGVLTGGYPRKHTHTGDDRVTDVSSGGGYGNSGGSGGGRTFLMGGGRTPTLHGMGLGGGGRDALTEALRDAVAGMGVGVHMRPVQVVFPNAIVPGRDRDAARRLARMTGPEISRVISYRTSP